MVSCSCSAVRRNTQRDDTMEASWRAARAESTRTCARVHSVIEFRERFASRNQFVSESGGGGVMLQGLSEL